VVKFTCCYISDLAENVSFFCYKKGLNYSADFPSTRFFEISHLQTVSHIDKHTNVAEKP